MDMVEDEENFVVVLIGKAGSFCQLRGPLLTLHISDEVESLTAARAGAMAGTEPSDALRVGFSSFTRNSILIYMHIGR